MALVAVVLAAAGVAGGYAYADLHASSSTEGGPGRPAAATGPAYPSTPKDPGVDNDPNDPPLAEDIPLVSAKLGEPGAGITLQVPEGWVRTNQPNGTESRWSFLPSLDTPYSVRVSLVDTRQSTQGMVAAKIVQLPFDSRIRELEVLEQDDDSAVFTYIFGRKRIEQVDRYVTLSGGPADVEIATSGRLVDDPGMRALVARMVDSLEVLPARPTESPSESASESPSESTTASPSQ